MIKIIPIAVLFGIVVAVAAAFLISFLSPQPQNPALPSNAHDIVAKAMVTWKAAPYPYASHFVDYSPTGPYLDNGSPAICSAVPGSQKLDQNGVAMIFMGGGYNYHPVFDAQCGLAAYTNFLKTGNNRGVALLYANKLIEMQDSSGAIRYPFAFRYYVTGTDLPIGWVSGMAQGQAISLFARAYQLDADPKYLIAGEKALDFLRVPTAAGGVQSTLADLNPQWSNNIIWEEYVADPPTYTLNGFLFTLLGVYDWSKLDAAKSYGEDRAQKMFEQGIDTVEKILPYYDLNGITAYDLGYITHKDTQLEPHVGAAYHGVHIMLLHALKSLVDSPTINYWYDRWLGYVR